MLTREMVEQAIGRRLPTRRRFAVAEELDANDWPFGTEIEVPWTEAELQQFMERFAPCPTTRT